MSNNSELRSFLKRINKKTKEISNSSELMSTLSEIESFERKFPEFRYNHKTHWIFFTVGLIATILGFLYIKTQQNYFHERDLVYLTPILISIISVVMIMVDKSLSSEISDRLFNLDVKFDNKIKDYEKSYDNLFTYLYNKFGDFSRGDEQRHLSYVKVGEYKGENHSFDYKAYKYHYVEVYYVPVTKKVGKSTITTMERRTRTCYRYGLLLDFPFAKDLAIVSSGGSYSYKDEWSTSSKDFEDEFNTYCNNKITATKFLKPAVILEILKLNENLSGMNLEFKDDKLNISYNDSNLLNLDRQYDIKEIKQFIEEINKFNELKKLKKIFKIIDKISTYVDNNFKGGN